MHSWLLASAQQIEAKDLVSWFLGLIAVAASVWAVFAQRSKAAPHYYYKISVLHTAGHPRLTVLFDGKQKIQNLTRILVYLVNVGNKEIRREDIPSGTLPSIELPTGVQLLSATLIHQSSRSIGASVTTSGNCVTFSFDYLNSGAGIAGEIYIDDPRDLSTKAKEASINFVADIKGAAPAKASTYVEFSPISFVTGQIALCAIAISFAWSAYNMRLEIQDDGFAYFLFLRICGVALSVAALVLVIVSSREAIGMRRARRAINSLFR